MKQFTGFTAGADTRDHEVGCLNPLALTDLFYVAKDRIAVIRAS
jgi:hypothetical protein